MNDVWLKTVMVISGRLRVHGQGSRMGEVAWEFHVRSVLLSLLPSCRAVPTLGQTGNVKCVVPNCI